MSALKDFLASNFAARKAAKLSTMLQQDGFDKHEYGQIVKRRFDDTIARHNKPHNELSYVFSGAAIPFNNKGCSHVSGYEHVTGAWAVWVDGEPFVNSQDHSDAYKDCTNVLMVASEILRYRAYPFLTIIKKPGFTEPTINFD